MFIFILDSEKAALLIGKRGQTLNALENLSQLVANKFSNSFMIIKLDVDNYRERRRESTGTACRTNGRQSNSNRQKSRI